ITSSFSTHSILRKAENHDPFAFHSVTPICVVRFHGFCLDHQERAPRTIPLRRLCFLVLSRSRLRRRLDHVSLAALRLGRTETSRDWCPPLSHRNGLSVLYKNVITGRNGSVMNEIPVNAAAAIGASHFLVIAEAEADDAGTVTVIRNKGRFAQDLESRIEAEGKFAEHAGVATGGGQFLVNFVCIHSLDGNMTVDETEHQVASLCGEGWPHRKKH